MLCGLTPDAGELLNRSSYRRLVVVVAVVSDCACEVVIVDSGRREALLAVQTAHGRRWHGKSAWGRCRDAATS